MALSVVSWAAVAVILAALGVAWSRRFLALGALTVANVLVYGFTLFGGTAPCHDGLVRATIHCELSLRGDLLAAGEPMAFLQLLTSMFVHADLFHLLGNVLILLAFSLPFEERIGARPFLLIYLASGLVGALFQLATDWGTSIPMMGASGAVFGIIGAFAGAFPRLVVPLPLPLVFIMIWVRTEVWKAAAAFAAVQVVFQVLSGAMGGLGGVAYMAHLGGLAAGIVLSQVYVRRRAAPVARRAVPAAELRSFARDPGAQRALDEMERSRDEPDVFGVWRDRFFERATCPDCGAAVRPEKDAIVCAAGHRFGPAPRGGKRAGDAGAA